MDRVQYAMKKAGLGGTAMQLDLKTAIYIAGGLFALVYLLKSVRIRKQSGKSWLNLRSRSPDPEKRDARKSAEQQTNAVRPFGSRFEKIVTLL
jgi:hypothetical protein